MIHRRCSGPVERFFGVLTDHYAGAFPAWLSPCRWSASSPVADAFGTTCRRSSTSSPRARDPRRGRPFRRPHAEEDTAITRPPRCRSSCWRGEGRLGRRGVVPVPRRHPGQRGATRGRGRGDRRLIRQRRNDAPTAGGVHAPAPAGRRRWMGEPSGPAGAGPTRPSFSPRTHRGARPSGLPVVDPAPDGVRQRRSRDTGAAPSDPGVPVLPDPVPVRRGRHCIVARGERVYAVLNLYPYNPGHLLVVPYRHIPDYTDLDAAELTEFSAFTGTPSGSSGRSARRTGSTSASNAGSAAAPASRPTCTSIWCPGGAATRTSCR